MPWLLNGPESIHFLKAFLKFAALDPAGPWFEVVDRRNMVSKDDAEFVDVIHTNSGSILNVTISDI